MDDMQQKVDKHQEDADHEYKDLLKLQVTSFTFLVQTKWKKMLTHLALS